MGAESGNNNVTNYWPQMSNALHLFSSDRPITTPQTPHGQDFQVEGAVDLSKPITNQRDTAYGMIP